VISDNELTADGLPGYQVFTAQAVQPASRENAAQHHLGPGRCADRHEHRSSYCRILRLNLHHFATVRRIHEAEEVPGEA
jgi:hypothetical protein